MSVRIPDDVNTIGPEDEHIAVVISKFLRLCQESEKVRVDNLEAKVEKDMDGIRQDVECIKQEVGKIDRIWINPDSGRMPRMWSVLEKGQKWLVGLAFLIIANIILSVAQGNLETKNSQAMNEQISAAIKNAVREAMRP